MKKMAALLGFAFVLGIFPAIAQVPQFPQTLPPNTVIGRTGLTAGPAQALPFSILTPSLLTGIMGDITCTTLACTISPGAVTNAKMANAPADTVKGNATGAIGGVTDVTMTQLVGQFGATPTPPLYGAQGSWWTNISDADGTSNARLHLFRDRMFIDDGVLITGANSSTLGAGAIIANSRSGIEINNIKFDWALNNSSLAVISSWGNQSITGMSVASSANRSGIPTGMIAIGLTGMSINDLATGLGPDTSWGIYGETIRTVSGAGKAIGIEVDTGTVSTVDSDPFFGGSPSLGTSWGTNWNCGGSSTGFAYANCTAAQLIWNNGARWRKGIVFAQNSLDTSVGTSAGGMALALTEGHEFAWYTSAGTVTHEFWSNTAGFHFNGGPMHVAAGGNVPTAATCPGFAAATNSNDFAGHASLTSATTCLINWANSYTNAPSCAVSLDQAANGPALAFTTSTTQLSVSAASAFVGFSWICVGS